MKFSQKENFKILSNGPLKHSTGRLTNQSYTNTYVSAFLAARRCSYDCKDFYFFLWQFTNLQEDSLIAFDDVLASTRPVAAFCVCICCILCVYGSHITITQSCTHTMQQTHTHKAVLGALKLKSYSVEGIWTYSVQ